MVPSNLISTSSAPVSAETTATTILWSLSSDAKDARLPSGEAIRKKKADRFAIMLALRGVLPFIFVEGKIQSSGFA